MTAASAVATRDQAALSARLRSVLAAAESEMPHEAVSYHVPPVRNLIDPRQSPPHFLRSIRSHCRQAPHYRWIHSLGAGLEAEPGRSWFH